MNRLYASIMVKLPAVRPVTISAIFTTVIAVINVHNTDDSAEAMQLELDICSHLHKKMQFLQFNKSWMPVHFKFILCMPCSSADCSGVGPGV